MGIGARRSLDLTLSAGLALVLYLNSVDDKYAIACAFSAASDTSGIFGSVHCSKMESRVSTFRKTDGLHRT